MRPLRDRTLEKAVDKIKQAPERLETTPRGGKGEGRRPEQGRPAGRLTARCARPAEDVPQGRHRLRRHPRAAAPRRDPRRGRDRPVLVARLEEAGLLGTIDGEGLQVNSRRVHHRAPRRHASPLLDRQPVVGSPPVPALARRPATRSSAGRRRAGQLGRRLRPPAAAPGRSRSIASGHSRQFDLPEQLSRGVRPRWRTMRDSYYDERLGNRNWDAIRRKYIDMAAEAPDLRRPSPSSST